MKINQFLKSIMFLAIGAMVFTSCTDDGTGGTGTGGPSITFSATSGQDLTVNPNEVFTVRVNASKGDSPLKSLKVLEGGSNVAFSRLTINGTAASSNPLLLFNDDKTSLTYDITIKAHSDVSAKTYAIEVGDEANATKSVSIVVTTNATPPTLTYNGPASFTAAPNSKVSLSFVAVKGSGKISTIAVYENETLIANATRLEIGSNVFSANPYPLPTTLQTGFDTKVLVKTGATPGANKYKVEITDEFGNTASQEMTISLGQPLDASLVGILFNKSGPAGKGGLDLDNGMSTGTGATTGIEAEIKDEGNVSATSTTWKKQVSGINGSEVRYIIKGQGAASENFAFADVAFKEQIVDLYEGGTLFTATNAAGEKISNVVNVGDIFSVKSGSKYYLLEVTLITNTTNDNLDSYTLNIKK